MDDVFSVWPSDWTTGLPLTLAKDESYWRVLRPRPLARTAAACSQLGSFARSAAAMEVRMLNSAV